MAQLGFGDFPRPMHWSLLFWVESVAQVRWIIVQILLKFYFLTNSCNYLDYIWFCNLKKFHNQKPTFTHPTHHYVWRHWFYNNNTDIGLHRFNRYTLYFNSTNFKKGRIQDNSYYVLIILLLGFFESCMCVICSFTLQKPYFFSSDSSYSIYVLHALVKIWKKAQFSESVHCVCHKG